VRWWVKASIDHGWTGPAHDIVRRAVVIYGAPVDHTA
jgi:hypothetical protein